MTLSFFEYPLILRHPFGVAGCMRTSTDDVQLSIHHDGLIGRGEASLPPYLGYTIQDTIAFLRQVDLSSFSSPEQLDDILDYVDALAPGQTPAKAAIDLALHDLLSQMRGQTVCQLFGLDASKAPATCFTIGIDTDEVVREKTLECAGLYSILKVKVGRHPEEDKSMIRAIRSVSDLPLVVDANQGWTDRSQALDMIYWLQSQGVQMVEQPMHKTRKDDLAWLTAHSPLPTFADESVQRLCDVDGLQGVFSGINIKLMKSTGLREARRMMARARELNMKVMIGCMTETSCAVTAAASLSPLVDFADLDGNLLIANDLYSGVTVTHGRLHLPALPGLGLSLLSNANPHP